MTQTELAVAIGLSQKQVSRIECGQFVAVPRVTVVRIAEALVDPLVNGEVNYWLASLGWAPLIRSGLPLPPSLAQSIEDSAPVPTWCIDPEAHIIGRNEPARRLFRGQPDQHVMRFLIDPRAALKPEWRDLILRELLLWLASAADEPWLDAWRQALPDCIPSPIALPPRSARDPVCLGGSMSWDALVGAARGLPPLHFYLGMSRVNSRPDLLLIKLYAADPPTLAWCAETEQPMSPPGSA